MQLGHPADYRRGDEHHPNSPWAVEPTDDDLIAEAINDAIYLAQSAAEDLSAGKRREAMSDARNAIAALQDAVQGLAA